MDDFLPERQASGKPGTQVPVGHAKFAFLLAALLCTMLIVVGCGADSAPMAESEDDAAVPEAAAAQEEAGAAGREPAAEAASAEDSEPAAPAEVAESAPEPASDPEPAPEEAVVAEPPDWTTHVFVEEGYYVLGNPDAEVSILDAGDFL